jgi:plastocyanin
VPTIHAAFVIDKRSTQGLREPIGQTIRITSCIYENAQGKEESMRRLSYLATLSVIALLTFVPAAGAWQNQGVVAVPIQKVVSASIQDFSFNPVNGAVAPGTTVMWTNEGSHAHTVTADDGSFDSGTLNPGDTFMVTFLGSGKASYHCRIHPFMKGSVTVGKSGAGATPNGRTSSPTAPSSPVSMNTPMGSGY